MTDHPSLSEQRALIERIDAELSGAPGSPDNRRSMLAEARRLLGFSQPPASGVDRSREASGYRRGVRDAAELSKAHDARGDTAKGILRLLKHPEAAFAQPPASGVDRVLPPGVNCSECGRRHFAAYTGDCVNCGAKEADFAALTNSGAPVPGDLRKRAEDLFNLIYAHTVVKYDPAAGIRCCEKALAHAAPAPSDEIDCELCDGVMSRACPRCNPCADEPEAGVPAGMVPSFGQPHPIWKGPDKAGRHPQSLEEWNPQNDPTGEHHVNAMKRLTVAGDYADPRVDDQMSLVHRTDVLTILHRLIWREAQVENYQQDEQATPTDEAVLGEREACAALADQVANQCRSDERKYQQDPDFAGAISMAIGGQMEAKRIAKAIRARPAPGSAGEASDA